VLLNLVTSCAVNLVTPWTVYLSKLFCYPSEPSCALNLVTSCAAYKVSQ
jgi:hypothetical protein